MARLPRAIDVLFEFDAPQTFIDLTAPLPALAPGGHDAWFDEVHIKHSKPSADLAREAAIIVRKLQDKEQQVKDVKVKIKTNRLSGNANKENQRQKSGDFVQTRDTQLQQKERKKYTSLKEMRATQDPFKARRDIKKKEQFSLERRRKPLMDARSRLNVRKEKMLPSGEKKEMKDWQELLKKHNKKFKATHTYEPPQHSVRDVKQWEREMKKSYYALSAEERVQANEEIAVWKQKLVERSQ